MPELQPKKPFPSCPQHDVGAAGSPAAAAAVASERAERMKPTTITAEQEQQANAFALAILMPRDMVLLAVNEQLPRARTRAAFISGMAKVFDVAEDHMVTRLFNLGVMPS